MGFTPQQANEMTLWEWQCVVNGWNKANSTEPEISYPTDAEFEQAVSLARH